MFWVRLVVAWVCGDVDGDVVVSHGYVVVWLRFGLCVYVHLGTPGEERAKESRVAAACRADRPNSKLQSASELLMSLSNVR